jgi:hypothetical protein
MSVMCDSSLRLFLLTHLFYYPFSFVYLPYFLGRRKQRKKVAPKAKKTHYTGRTLYIQE